MLSHAPQANGALPNHPIITEVYTDPPGDNDAPVGRLPGNSHQEYIEIYIPPLASLSPSLNKDALRLTFYEVEGDSTSTGVNLVNYRFDLPTFDLDSSNGITPGAIQRPSNGVVVLGWVDYVGNPPTGLAGTTSTRIALINGGITTTGGTYTLIAINGNHFTGTTNFPVLVAESKIDLPAEASSGVIQNGSGAYLLVNRDAAGYVELCDDQHVGDCSIGAFPDLPNDLSLLNTDALLDGYAGNDDSNFDVTLQPYDPGQGLDLETSLPLSGAFSNLVAQIPESETALPAPGTANGYARRFVDVAKTTDTGATDNPVLDATTAYRHIRNNGPFFPTPGAAALTTSPGELGLSLSAEHVFEVLYQSTGRPGILAANVGGNFSLNLSPSVGASSNPAVATFAAGATAASVPGQSYGLPTIAITPAIGAAHGSTANVNVTITASNAGAGPPVVAPVQMRTMTATVLNPATGLRVASVGPPLVTEPFQTTVFAAVQSVSASASTNEFLTTSLGSYVAANLGASVFDTLGHGSVLVDSGTDIGDGFFVQTALVVDFPNSGEFINFPGPTNPPGKLDLRNTVLQSAEVVSGATTYDGSIDGSGLRAVRLNIPDFQTFGASFTPTETIHFADAIGDVGGIRSGLTNASTTRTFELAIIDTNVRDDSSLESGATDDFGIIIEVEATEAGSPVVNGEFVFLSFTGGLQGADIDSLDVAPHSNVATIIYLDLDNLHDVLGIQSIEQIFLVDGSGTGEVDPIEIFSLKSFSAGLITSDPPTEKSLWRSSQNIVRLTFGQNITAPAAGNILIQPMLTGGGFGTNVAAGFSFTVENDIGGNPRILKITDTGVSDLVHRQWYAIRNTGGWIGGPLFTVQYVTQIGDANADGQVLNIDAGFINAGIPNFSAPDNDRRDIDGDAKVLNGDVSTANARVPSFTVSKPSGHP